MGPHQIETQCTKPRALRVLGQAFLNALLLPLDWFSRRIAKRRIERSSDHSPRRPLTRADVLSKVLFSSIIFGTWNVAKGTQCLLIRANQKLLTSFKKKSVLLFGGWPSNLMSPR